jgi:hypothetical protein
LAKKGSCEEEVLQPNPAKREPKNARRGASDFEAESFWQKEGEQRIRCSWKMNAVIN